MISERAKTEMEVAGGLLSTLICMEQELPKMDKLLRMADKASILAKRLVTNTFKTVEDMDK